jgi:cyclophilin family peptidyl-prolyl cis-trans isomerase
MKRRISLVLLVIAAAFAYSCKDEHSDLEDGLYAEMETSKGTILLDLNFEKAPITVANFVSLAEGTNTYVDEKYKGKPFFDGLKFHRVINDFMIQGGDPAGNGSGDAGYKFQDEITDLKHDGGGVLSMANSGPGTNSSQFFITHIATPWLDGLHTIFGHVVGNGMETVNKIVQDDVILSVKIIRKGEAAKKFNAVKTFGDYFAGELKNQKKKAAVDAENNKAYLAKYQPVVDQKKASFDALKPGAQKSPTGLEYKITHKGNGKKPAPGTIVYINYAGFLDNGQFVDTNIETIAAAFGKFEQQRAMQRGYRPIEFPYGTKTGMIPGFIEGLEKMSYGDKAILFIPSELGFGAQGAGQGVVPPNASLVFEIEMLEAPAK